MEARTRRGVVALLVAAATAAVALIAVAAAAAAGTAPTNTAPPSISGSAVTGKTMTAQPGTWIGTQPITYKYQWQRCDKSGTGCSDIAGATTNTYLVGSSDQGSTLRVRVTASNSAGSSSATSAQTSVVTAPVATSVALRAGRTLLVYGTPLTLTGTVAGAQAGSIVTIWGTHPGSKLLKVADATVQSDGTFSATIHPRMRTAFIAKIDGVQSTPVLVNVRPRVVVHRLAGHRFSIDVLAARPLLRRYVLIQRWVPSKHLWRSVERVYLNHMLTPSGVTAIVSSGLFRLHLGGVMTRVFVPLGQIRPAYVSGTSSAFSA